MIDVVYYGTNTISDEAFQMSDNENDTRSTQHVMKAAIRIALLLVRFPEKDIDFTPAVCQRGYEIMDECWHQPKIPLTALILVSILAKSLTLPSTELKKF